MFFVLEQKIDFQMKNVPCPCCHQSHVFLVLVLRVERRQRVVSHKLLSPSFLLPAWKNQRKHQQGVVALNEPEHQTQHRNVSACVATNTVETDALIDANVFLVDRCAAPQKECE